MQFDAKDVEDEWLLIDVNEETKQPAVLNNEKGNFQPTNDRENTKAPDSPFITDRVKKIPRKSLKAKGNDAFRSLKFKKAIELYSLALEAGEDDGKGLFILYSNRSNAYYKTKMYDLALKDAERAIEICPTFAKGYHRVAVANIALNNVDEAKKAYSAAIKIEPDNQAYKQLLNDLN